jgi:5-amino-6-(5-phospho-D-ribitylamino)uracil phosphatase
MDYKALIFDLDGTAIPNRRDGMPSRKVIQAVKKAVKNIHVSAASGRSIVLARPIITMLGLVDPCILSGGTEIMVPQTEKVLWEEFIPGESARQIFDITHQYPYRVVYSTSEQYALDYKKERVKGEVKVVYIHAVRDEHQHKMMQLLHEIEDIVTHPVSSWEKGTYDLHITSPNATKKHALHKLQQILGVTKKETIVVGDSNNDIPLFEGAGFRVAMGNGTDKLKEQADYITASVDNDGLAEVIEKFILKNPHGASK